MARRVARASARRGATRALEPRIRNEVGAIAVVAAALELWFGFMRRDAVLPIVGGTIAVLALLGLARHYLRDDLAGGLVGGVVAKAANGAFGDVGAPIALFALLLAGVVMAANRTLADLAAP